MTRTSATAFEGGFICEIKSVLWAKKWLHTYTNSSVEDPQHNSMLPSTKRTQSLRIGDVTQKLVNAWYKYSAQICQCWSITCFQCRHYIKTRTPQIGWARQNAAPLKFDPKSSEAAFSVVPTGSCLCCYIRCGWMFVQNLVILGCWIIREFLADWTRFKHFCAVFNCILPPNGAAASDVIDSSFQRPVVPDECVAFRDPLLNRSRETPPEANGGSILRTLPTESSIVTSHPVYLQPSSSRCGCRSKFWWF